ncbi:MAG TPA: GNAT family N-acetyltransferase [Acidimicrobiales bacterium]|nr:GNAT family N-acetyltransferase [Acidimicrobiales bacterium]
MITRIAIPEDVASVAGVHVRSWQAAYRGLFSDEYLDGLRAEDRMARYTFGETGTGDLATIVAVDDGAVCGFATTGLAQDEDVPGTGEVYALYVDPGAWGRGVGRLLMVEARTDIGRRRDAPRRSCGSWWATGEPSAFTAPMGGCPMEGGG